MQFINKSMQTEILHINGEQNEPKTPLFVAPGWSETCNTLQFLCKSLAKHQKRKVYTISHPRTGVEIKENPQFPLEEWRKANTILETLEACNLNQVDVIAHSEGCINAIIAASVRPEIFKTIILVTPAGLIGEDNLEDISKRFFQELAEVRLLGPLKKQLERFHINLEKRKASKKSDKQAVKDFSFFRKESTAYALANPKRAWDEVQAIASFQTPDLIQKLIASGVQVCLVLGEQDAVFPANRILEQAKNIPFQQIETVKNGRHFDLCLYPDDFQTLFSKFLSH